MRYGSVCSGIEAATAAWHHMGWKPAFFSEIDPFPRAVLSHHYPDVPLHDDFTTIGANQYGSIGLLVGGTPCQSFSVAGLRKGLDDDRGNLALEFLRLADRERPEWIVWENVPGVLSSNGGRDFGAFLGALAEIGYGFAYRVLDARFFGIPQRRRRLFVVGYIAEWRYPAAVLFQRETVAGVSQAMPEIDSRGKRFFMPGNRALDRSEPETLGARDYKDPQIVASALEVRKLTCVEYERLQGFPDGFTQIPYRNKPADKCPDGPRYKALGNSMAVPVMRWIGERINEVNKL